MKGNFQIIVLVIFIIGAVLGLLVFSGAIKIGNNTGSAGSLGTVTMWGTQNAGDLANAFEDFNKANPTFTVNYVQKFPETFDQDLLEALASGVGPDMFLLSDDLAVKYSNKIYTIPYSSFPVASYKNTFAGAGDVFLTSNGILAFPISIDPLVMYYNRAILDANNIVYPPSYWDEFQNLVPLILKKDTTSNQIIKSPVALGQFSNVTNAKGIISTIFMQLGNPIVTEKDGSFYSTLTSSNNAGSNLNSVLKFYTDFTDPIKNLYSWNRALPSSRDFFTSDNLAFYFGYASELKSIINKNPNLNFQVAQIPQVRNANFKLTGGHVTGIAIASSSKNFNTAFTAASLMATGTFASNFANALYTVPARRDLLSVKTTDAYFPIFYASALYTKAWLDPSVSGTDQIFKNMIEGVLSNNMTAEEAITDAGSKIDLLLAR